MQRSIYIFIFKPTIMKAGQYLHKIFLIVLSVVMCCSQKMFAQVKKGQFDVSVGGGIFSPAQVSLGGDRESLIYGGISGYFLTGRYFLTKRLAIGVACGAQVINGKVNNSWAMRTQNPMYTFSQVDIVLAPELTLVYMSKPLFQAYGSIGTGVSRYSENRNYDNAGGHSKTEGVAIEGNITFLGLRIGRQLGGFLELGVGYKGVVSGGVSYRL